jgi:hypothetical protein
MLECCLIPPYLIGCPRDMTAGGGMCLLFLSTRLKHKDWEYRQKCESVKFHHIRILQNTTFTMLTNVCFITFVILVLFSHNVTFAFIL